MTVPVIFFIGGFSNSILLVRCLESGKETRAFLLRRARRLLIPTAVFIGSWVCVEILLNVLDLGGFQLIRGSAGTVLCRSLRSGS
jgi:peptidoglycan/LPS O-acetylase OafA/YrhL